MLVTPYLSIIIPAYNEESRIIDSLMEVIAYLDSQEYQWEVIVVNDGSSDCTVDFSRRFAQNDARVIVVDLPHRGKGGALKEGFSMARGKFMFMCDADLSMPLAFLPCFLPPLAPKADIVVGSRAIKGSQRYDEPKVRHIMGRVFNWLVRILAVRGIKDTQCGFKCFSTEAVQKLIPLQRLNGFGFDAEMLFLASKLDLLVVEIPIDWHYNPDSKVRPIRDSLRTTLDLLNIRWSFLTGRYKINQF